MKKRKSEGATDKPEPAKRTKTKATYVRSRIWTDESKALSDLMFSDLKQARLDAEEDLPLLRLTKQTWFTVKATNVESTAKPDWQTVELRLPAVETKEEAVVAKPDPEKDRIKHEKAKERQKIKAAKWDADKEAGLPTTTMRPQPPRTPEQKRATAEKKRNKTPTTRARRVLLDLNDAQKDRILRWMGMARQTYNECVKYHAEHEGEEITLETLRELCVNKNSPFVQKNEYMKKMSYAIREGAMQEFATALATGKKKLREGKIKKLNMHFRTRKKCDSESIALLAKQYRDGVPYKKGWKVDLEAKAVKRKRIVYLPPLTSKRHDLPPRLSHDSKLVRKGSDFFLCVAVDSPKPKTGVPNGPLPTTPKKTIPQKDKEEAKRKKRMRWLDTQEPDGTTFAPKPEFKIASIDPGVRTFASIYDPDGKFIEWAPGDVNRLGRLSAKIDQINSKIALSKERVLRNKNGKPTNSKTRWRMKRAAKRLYKRQRNLVDEVHNKLVKYLCESYNVVLLPEFNVSQMVKKKNARGRKRIIGRRTARDMLNWSFYRFKQKLLYKAEEYPWFRVVLTTEEYTSKTCSVCGHLHSALGGSKVFSCPSCGFRTDRDFNGARMIHLKWLTNAHVDMNTNNTLQPISPV